MNRNYNLAASVLSLFVACLLLAAPAPSQEPAESESEERTPEIPQLYVAQIGMADVPLIAMELDLDDGQTEILRQLLLDYLTVITAERERYLEQILQEAKPRPQDDPDYRARHNHRKQVSRIRSSKQGQAATQAILQEMEAMASRDVPRSRRLSLIRAWQASREQAYSDLIENMGAILEGTHPGHWPAISRAIRRRNSPWAPQFTPEGVNLGMLVYTYWGKESEAAREAYDAILAYDIAYDEALQRRDQILARTEPERLDAYDFRHPERLISTRKDQVDARVAMWRVNDEHVDLIAAAMGDQGPDFRALAMDTMYPDIYPTHRFEHAVEYAIDEEQLSDDQRKSIEELRNRFLTTLIPLNERRVSVFRASEPERYMRGEEDGAMLRCYQSMAGLNGDMESIHEMARLNEQRRELGRRSREELRQIVGEARYDQWPGYATRPSVGDIARGPVPNADPNMPVVYMKDMMRQSNANSGGD